jgi:23S rRNA pseudouridine1911/1915/1917 synthase
VTVHYALKENDTVTITASKPLPAASKKTETTAAQPRRQPEVIAETEDYLVINKPAGLLVHPTEKQEDWSVAAWLKEYAPAVTKIFQQDKLLTEEERQRPGIVHRLDADVSGLMVIAKTLPMYFCLKEQFQERKIKKIYLALVYGVTTKESGDINLPIGRATAGHKMAAHTTQHPDDRSAKTEYQTLRRFLNHSFLAVTIHTGRTHQIRAHLQAIGYPLVGDPIYHPKKDNFHDSTKKIKIKHDLDRPFLHSANLGFYDLANNWQEFSSPLPAELDAYLAQLPKAINKP